jgi:hypothetical protein
MSWPLYFRAFGDYKNPTYIYLLAAVFKVAGLSIGVARGLSATLGLATGALLVILGWRISRNVVVALAVGVSALLTPWLYESSRLVFEVAIYPALTALFLITVHRASQKQEWRLSEIVTIAVTFALLTYSYSTGRLLAPLLALGLALFIPRVGWRAVLKTWLACGVTLIPLLLFYRSNPAALTDRFALLTYITPEATASQIASQFIRHFLLNLNPWRWLVTGENNVRDHVSGSGSLLVATVILAVSGLVIVCGRYRREPWWQFVIYGLFVSVVPASLTVNEFPQLRLITFPVFFHAFTIPVLMWLVAPGDSDRAPTPNPQRRRTVFVLLVILVALQGAYFQWLFHSTAHERWYVFDERYQRKVLTTALQTNKSPIYLFDPPGNSGYIQAYWYGALQGLDSSRFVHLHGDARPPAGGVVISSEEICDNCVLLSKSINYVVYAVHPTELEAQSTSLPPGAIHASLTVQQAPPPMKPASTKTFEVIVKNIGSVTWPAVGAADTNVHATTLRARWCNADGKVLSEQYLRQRFPFDMEPGDTAGIKMEIEAPEASGDYLLMLDVTQIGEASNEMTGTLQFPISVRP